MCVCILGIHPCVLAVHMYKCMYSHTIYDQSLEPGGV